MQTVFGQLIYFSGGGLEEGEQNDYHCTADYIDQDVFVPGEDVLIKNTGTGLIQLKFSCIICILRTISIFFLLCSFHCSIHFISVVKPDNYYCRN